ncbi:MULTISPECIES: excinuclease ABC subunit UvrA [Klebsiella pneumoniae complex]|jgi:excinuclease ABC subunit A|uniref:UvrABC system protein A n=1 Tax=Klebsiella pneumoniae TaxID=573 RepID=A0A486QLT5_KLEPN|nr:excinuclease ABC subunit A [Klebsiella pneumoniae]SSK35680.1 uvrABC system protein a [Klebsiella pneumoniae]VGH25485.1 uvrABC system protein a [Klebsiella pneumoniae]VGJ47080.1 uvrABC system protein a [Klebsiella pneumoniae]VGL90552.1 uvrABC system protein a [Klebsiella pneumoniae]
MLYAEDFSPNTPQGACPSCHGLGHIYEVTETLMVPDPSLSIRERAIASWRPAWHGQNLRDILVTLGYDIDTPWKNLPAEDRQWILFTEDTPTVPVFPGLSPEDTREAVRKKMTPGYMGTFTGARRYVLHTFASTQSALMRKRLAAQRLTGGVMARLYQLQKLGLGYLTLDRATPTLSAGELQRLRLATQLSSMLFGVVYVLDEPSAGLHPSDSKALYDALENLRDAGNSVFVVEHDLNLIRRAQWLVDVGPSAGEQGGHVLYSGIPEDLKAVTQSRTARYLFDEVRPPQSFARIPSGWLKLQGIHRQNLKWIDVDIPLGVLTAVTGVSGSGKSSLIAQALPELVLSSLGGEPEDVLSEASDAEGPSVTEKTYGTLTGDTGLVKRLLQVDQKPIGRTPRSNLATYTGLFDPVRKLFAGTTDAKLHHYDAGQFSFNVAKGRCATCEGEGFVSVELLFMPSVYAPCPTCHGARYNRDTLRIYWQDKNIAEVLHMKVDEASQFFATEEPVARPLRLLSEIGLGYLRLGQPATELSGGEAQRIMLATELQRSQRGHTLYILDETTTGLHASDADRLLVQLQRLVDAENTVIMIVHDMRAVTQADQVIDIGPGAGHEGGRLVAAGTPEQVSQVKESRTAQYIARELSRNG